LKPINATKDFLTNCYTREAFIPFLKKMEEEFLTNKKPFSLLMMDVDHFKSFNDKYGHMYGDEVLKYFSSSLRLDLEDEENVPFRFGGDEFVMVFPNKTANEAHHLATRLRRNIRTRSCLIKGRQISVTFSGGIAGYPENSNNVEDTIEKADKALYYSKNHGRGRIMKFSDLARKEFLQMSLIVGVLAMVGSVLYANRQELSVHVGDWSSEISTMLVRPKDIDLPTRTKAAEPERAPESVAPAGEVAVVVEPETPAISEIELDSGRVVRGVIKHEDDEVVEVEVGLQEGTGILQIKKSQVVRIRRA